MIPHPLLMSSWPVENMESLYDCPILVRNHQQCRHMAPELWREPGSNSRGSNSLAITLAVLVLSGSWCPYPCLEFAGYRPLGAPDQQRVPSEDGLLCKKWT